MITLLTDFGTADYFVGAMKGVILSVNREESIIDITHQIPPHDIRAGAFTLLAVYETFPPQTVHVAVVDPGVGSSRRPILVTSRNYLFVGPDNGLFSYICEREREVRVFHLTNEKYFRTPVSHTFHGRDIFAPAAAAAATGVAPTTLGGQITDYVLLPPLTPVRERDGTLAASIIHIDRFGNCITNITRPDLAGEAFARGARLVVNGNEIGSFRHYFAEGEDTPEELFAIWGSAGFLEIAARCRSAAQMLKAERGHSVLVKAAL